MHVKYYFERLQ